MTMGDFHKPLRRVLLSAGSPVALGFAVLMATSAEAQTGNVADAPATSQDSGAAPDQSDGETDIVVTGIRASQARSIEVKRNADSVVEAISAQDIGKLPDVTISDSLQRIPGVQIRRDAGEGGAINIRGLPQVTTLFNGEEFLGANSVTTVQPNFNDIPSQLFSGATVFKSPTASLQQAGLSGTVDLLTRRPFDLKNGVTIAGAVEGQYGDRTKNVQPSANGLIAFNSGRFGALVSAAYSDLDLANSFRGIQDFGVRLRNEAGTAANQGDFAVGTGVNRGRAVRNAQGGIIGYDVNGDGDANDTFITPQNHNAWNRVTSRERFGANASLQFEINDTLRLTGDGFYTKQTQYDRLAGLSFNNIDWQSSPYLPTASRDTGAVDPNNPAYKINTVQTYLYDIANVEAYAENRKTVGESQNYNLQLDWKPGDTFKATVRGIYGKATRRVDNGYATFSLSNGSQWGYNRAEGRGIGNYPTGDRAFNPNGYVPYNEKATIDYSSGAPVFTYPASFLTQVQDPSRYGFKTMSSENNVREQGDIWAVRADAEWQPSERFGVKFGGRYSERSVDTFNFERVVPLYAGNRDNAANPAGGCLVKWLATDVNLEDRACSVRDAAGNPYTAGFAAQGNDPRLQGLLKQATLPAAGTPPILTVDPKALDNIASFIGGFYPGLRENVNPANSYGIDLRQVSGYAQVSGEGELLGLSYRANGGVRIVNTRFTARQNVVGAPQPYGVSGVDGGDVSTRRDFTDFLPAFNLAFDLTERLRLRGSYAKTMTLLNFDQWGGGLNVNYAINTTTQVFEANTASSTGNPQLNPWRADNVEASLEYYTGRSSLVALGVFHINVDSFIANATILRNDIPDNDGVIRRAVPTATSVQGAGGTLKGIEASARQSLRDYGVGGLFGGFGVDANYTLSLGDAGRVDLAGNKQPFQDNSKHQVNAALWFEQYGLQARVAYNYRSKRLVSSDYGGISGLAQYQRPTSYLDASVSYDILPYLTVYGQASNLTGETERYYLTWKDQVFNENIYERRFIAGVRARF
jgi:TonB-dependent receptor